MRESYRESRRMETSIFISLILWTIIFLGLSFVRLDGPELFENSMNPLYVELASPEYVPELPPEAPPEPVGGRSPDASPAPEITGAAEVPALSASPSAAPPSAQPRPAQDQAASTAPASIPAAPPASPAEPRLSPSLVADPGAAPAPSQPRAPSRFQGGDPFAAPDESSLRSEIPPAPSESPAPAARSNLAEGSRAAATASPRSEEDRFGESLSDLENRLAAGGSSGGTSGTGTVSGSNSAGGSAGTAAPSSAGTITTGQGSFGPFDFGDGPERQLWSSRRINIPPRLLEGQPDLLVSAVSFDIERGGTVLSSTIRFDPPIVHEELRSFLSNFFGSWQFSPADSNGQVRFRYSIKVR